MEISSASANFLLLRQPRRDLLAIDDEGDEHRHPFMPSHPFPAEGHVMNRQFDEFALHKKRRGLRRKDESPSGE